MSNPAPKLESPSRFGTDILLLAGFCGFFFFFGLAYFGLLGADEPRYAQVAREMLAHRDWITPTLGGKPWLEKPVLYYWQAIIAYRIFGVCDLAARIPSAMDATLMIVAVYLFLRRFRPGFHLDGALITASCAGVIGFARAASTDMPLAATFTIAMLAWCAWYESRSRIYLALSYLFLGLGVLAKGPIALILAVLVVALFATLRHEFRLLRQTAWIPGIVVFLVIVLPWYVAVQTKNPEFFRVFILQHNLARFGTNLYHHAEPFWYFLPVALLALLPWTAFAIVATSQAVGKWRKRRDAEAGGSFSLFLLIWLLVPVAFFSISQSKLPGYILPSIPAGALLVVEYIRTHCAKEKSPHPWQIAVHAILASGLLVPALMIQYILLQHRMPLGKAVVPVVFATVCAISIVAMVRISGWRMLRFATLIPAVLVVGIVLRFGSPLLDASLSARPLAKDIASLQPKRASPGDTMQVTVFEAPRETEFGLAFYLDRPISRYERHEIPVGEHLVVAPEGSQTAVASAVPGRRVSYLGTIAAQRLDFFWVEAQK